MRCPRCTAHVRDDVLHVQDTADGLYVVVEAPVADHIHACRCGCDIAITSGASNTVHPGQLSLIQGVA